MHPLPAALVVSDKELLEPKGDAERERILRLASVIAQLEDVLGRAPEILSVARNLAPAGSALRERCDEMVRELVANGRR